MAKPTSRQMGEFWALVNSGHITRANFNEFLRNRGGGIVEYELHYGPSVVCELADEGGPWGFRNENINDDNYPVNGEGVVKVKFQFFPGEELKRPDGWVYRSDVEAYFRERGMRFCNAAEALLPPAKDKQLGRGEHPYVAFIGESGGAFIVGGDGRVRRLYRSVDDERWGPDFVFVGVCE